MRQSDIHFTGKYAGRSEARSLRRSVNTRAISVLLAAIACAVLFLHIGITSVAARESRKCEVVYASVEIQAGDSLWSVAGRYMDPSRQTMTEYIEELRSLNHLHEDTLYAGAWLVVPVTKDIP